MDKQLSDIDAATTDLNLDATEQASFAEAYRLLARAESGYTEDDP